MTFSFECLAITHIGNRRKNNEDNFYIGEVLLPEEQATMLQSGNRVISKGVVVSGTENRIFAVSDGMGGYKNGEVASYMVVDALDGFIGGRRERPGHRQKASHKQSDKLAYIQAFQKMIVRANKGILEYDADGEPSEGMGATLSGIMVFSDEAVPFNIGDSSTFLYEDGSLRKLTSDDNEAAMYREVDVTKLEANGKRLTKYFGLLESSGMLTATISTPIPLRLGQVYLAASDGLTDSLPTDSISDIIKANSDNINKAAEGLVEAALAENNGGRDNITVVMVRVTRMTRKGM